MSQYLRTLLLAFLGWTASAAVYRFVVVPRLPGWHEVPLIVWLIQFSPVVLAGAISIAPLRSWRDLVRHTTPFAAGVLLSLTFALALEGSFKSMAWRPGELPATVLQLMLIAFVGTTILFIVLYALALQIRNLRARAT